MMEFLSRKVIFFQSHFLSMVELYRKQKELDFLEFVYSGGLQQGCPFDRHLFKLNRNGIWQDYFKKHFHSYGQRHTGGGGNSAMKKRKLNYRFHNPNTAEVTADYLLKILIEANASKVEQAIQEAADELPNEPKHDGGCPA